MTLDGNEATANIAHLCNEVMAIYPITPSSNGRDAGRLGRGRRKNILAPFPTLSDASRSRAAVHGSLQAGT